MHFLRQRRTWLAWWDGRLRSLLFDLLVAVGTIRWGVDLKTDLSALDIGIMIPAVLALVVRRRFPWLPIAAAGGMAFVTSIGSSSAVAVYTMARRRGPCPQLWIAGGLVLGFLELAAVLQMPKPDLGYVLLVPPFVVGVSGLLGLWIFQRRMLMVTLRERAEQAERERDLLAERAVAAERRRVAREMHDVVAHRVSVISLQAGGLSMAAQDERTREVAEVIRKTSATALTELRSMLRVLRDDERDESGQHGELANDPTVGSIESLVGDAVESGANIRLELPDPLPETSGAVGRAAYRVVQEALTNAAKHAPHAAVHVDVTAEDEELVVTVSNRRGRSSDSDAVPGSGYGLIGMRERVTLAGGTLRTGWAEDGDYRVRAVFPARSEEVVA